MKFLPGIHGLRAFAALSVAIFHFSHLARNVEMPSWIGVVQNYFGLGVQLFFVLSAFSLAHSTFDRMNEPSWVRHFMVKRFFRIAPLFYIAIIFFTLYDYLAWGKIHTFEEYVLNLLFVHNLAPGFHESLVWAGWTIGVEMLFYVLFPTVLALTTSLRAALLFFVISVLIGATVGGVLTGMPGLPASYAYMSLPRALPAFAAGLLAFHVYRWLQIASVSTQLIALVAGPVALVCAIGGVFTPHTQNAPELVAWVACFGALCVWQASAPDRISGSKLFQYLGERSYSIYLVHAFLIASLKPAYSFFLLHLPAQPRSLGFLVCLLFALSCVIALASLTYKFIEVPFIRFGSRWTRMKPSGMAITSPAAGLIRIAT